MNAISHAGILSPRRRAERDSRVAVVCAVLSFVALQLALVVATATRWPELHDPQYDRRLVRLKERLADEPGKPLLVALGSSRMFTGLQPRVLASAWPRQADEPIIFNFARLGSGALFELLYLNRLLSEGIRPDWVLLEFWPFFLRDEIFVGQDLERLDVARLESADWEILAEHWSKAQEAHSHWTLGKLYPWYTQRAVLMGLLAPSWEPQSRTGPGFWLGVDDSGWRAVPGLTHERFDELTRPRPGQPTLSTDFKRVPLLEQLFRETIELCAKNGIATTLVFMPESKGLRDWYTPEAWREIAAYLRELQRAHGVGLVDARDWLPDDDFVDSHHLTTAGSATFSQRFAREVAAPVRGRPIVPLRAPAEEPRLASSASRGD